MGQGLSFFVPFAMTSTMLMVTESLLGCVLVHRAGGTFAPREIDLRRLRTSSGRRWYHGASLPGRNNFNQTNSTILGKAERIRVRKCWGNCSR